MKKKNSRGDSPSVRLLQDKKKRSGEVQDVDTPQSENLTYKQKVFDYLAEHREDEVFQKIYNMEQLTIQDVHELERIMWEELGTKEQYEEYCRREQKIYGGNVAALIRSLCQIDRVKAHHCRDSSTCPHS